MTEKRVICVQLIEIHWSLLLLLDDEDDGDDDDDHAADVIVVVVMMRFFFVFCFGFVGLLFQIEYWFCV